MEQIEINFQLLQQPPVAYFKKLSKNNSSATLKQQYNLRIINKQRSKARTRLDCVILRYCNHVMRQANRRRCLLNILEHTVRNHYAETLRGIKMQQILKLHGTEDGGTGTCKI